MSVQRECGSRRLRSGLGATLVATALFVAAGPWAGAAPAEPDGKRLAPSVPDAKRPVPAEPDGKRLAPSVPDARRPAPAEPDAKLIARSELDGKRLHELQRMRAEPLARAGLVFVEWWLREHFEKQSFYRPGRYDEARLTDVDRKNLATIDRYVASIPRAVLVARWEALRREHGWAGGPGRRALSFSPDGRTLVSYPLPLIHGRGPGNLWDAASGRRLGQLSWPGALVTRGYFPTPYGQRLGTEKLWPKLLRARFVGAELVVASEYHVMLGAPLSAQPKRTLLIGPNWNQEGGRESGVDAACIAPDGATLVTLAGSHLKSFDLRKGRPLHSHSIPRGDASFFVSGPRCQFFDDSRALVSAEHGGDSYVWDTKAQSVTRLAVPRGMSRMETGGERLAVWGVPHEAPPELAVWELGAAPKEFMRLAGTRGARNAWFMPDGKGLLVAGAGGSLSVFDLQNGSPTLWRGGTTFVRTATHPTQPDSLNGQLFPLLVEDARETLDQANVPDLVSDVAFSPDGSRVAIAYDSGRIEMRDAHTGRRFADFRGHEPWSAEETWEASLLARRGLKFQDEWPKPPQDVNPLDHLAALDHVLPKSALEPLSRLDLRLLRNTISARRGASFKAGTLTGPFSQTSWYQPNPNYTPALLTSTDRANIRAIQRREAILGGPLTEAEAIKHTNFRMYTGMLGWQLLPHAPDPPRTGTW